MSRSKGSEVLLGWAVIGVGAGLWEVVAHVKGFRFLPAPTVVFSSIPTFITRGGLGNVIVPSLWRVFVGICIASFAGVAVGITIGYFSRLDAYSRAVIDFVRSIPVAAVVPLAIMMFGSTDTMSISVIAFGSVWPILVNAVDGSRRVDPVLIDTARVSGLPNHGLLFRVILPASLPQIVAGLRVALAIALIMVILSEMIGSVQGIGYHIVVAQRGFRVPQVYAGVLMIGILGWLFHLAFRILERYVLAWHFARSERS